MKRCNRCGIEKELSEFGKDMKQKDNLNRACKECESIRLKKYYEKNKEKVKRHVKEYALNNPDKIKTKNKKNYWENVEENRKKAIQYRAKTKNTLDGFIRNSWKHMNERAINGRYFKSDAKNIKSYLVKGIEIRITKEEFVQFCNDNKNKIESMLKETDIANRPSIDRINEDGHYEIDNMQILSVSENGRKGANYQNRLRSD